MIYARSPVEKALAHIIAGDSALKSDIIKQLQVVSAANEGAIRSIWNRPAFT